jgi:hypothetical protein
MIENNSAITAKELAAKWGVDLFNLAYIILKHNLSVLSPPEQSSSEAIFNIKEALLSPEKVLETIGLDHFKLSDKLFLREEIDNFNLEAGLLKIYAIASTLAQKKMRSKLGEVETKPTIPGEQHSKETPKDITFLRDLVESHEPSIRKRPNVFSLVGRNWFIKYNQTEWGLYSDYEKYKYIASILSLSSGGNGGHQSSIDNRVLVLMINNNLPDDISTAEDEIEDLNNLDMGDNISDQDRARLKDLGNQLASKIKAAELSDDPEYKREVQEQFDEFRRIMSSTYGIACGISPRGGIFFQNHFRASNELEKLRNIIRGHVRKAIKDFSDRMPILSKHLQNSIKLQQFQTSYSPEQPTPWYVSM